MDNIGELLIFAAFIIISIINSVAKKKAKQKKSQEAQQNPVPSEEIPREKTGTILDDLFKVGAEEEEKGSTYYGEDSIESSHRQSWDPAEEFGLKTIKTSPISEKLSSQDLARNRFTDKMAEMEQKKSQKGESILADLGEIKVKKVITKNKYAELLHKTKSLKEYVLVSEILAKPKALRK